MKKMITKFAALMLICAMLLTMTACGGGDKDALIGTWEGNIDITELFNSMMADSLGAEMAEYIVFEDIEIRLVLKFGEDDSYSMELDQDRMFDTMGSIKDQMRVGMELYFTDMIVEMGMGEYTVDEVLAASGTSMDELMEEAMSPEAMMEIVESMADEMDTAGKFEAKGGKLYMTDIDNDNFDDAMYDEYELSGDKLTLITSSEDNGDAAFDLYPMTFKRIK